ncbi:MAG: glycosyltransferase family 4 protein [Aquificaceae bacterium]
MLRILQVVNGVGWCGTKEQTYLITKELTLRGFEVHMALSFQYELMVEKLKDYGVKFHFFENHNKVTRLNPLNYYRLWKIINKEGPFHIVIAVSPHAFDFVRVATSFIQRRPKIVAYKRTGKSSNILSNLLKYSAADRIVVVDKKTYEKLKEEGFYPNKLVYIPSGLDLYRFKVNDHASRLKMREKLGIHPKSKVFINVANWDPRKGQPFLISAFAKLKCPECICLLVGLKTDVEVPEYAKRYGLEGRLIGLGYREDIPELLNMADYFVFSSYLEGLAGSLLQAMACGKIVISTLAGGIRDYLKDGENGFAVDIGDMEGFVDRLRKALSLSEEERKRLSEKAQRTAQVYSIKNTVDNYVELFKELTDKTSALQSTP